MKITVSGKHIEVGDSLRNHIETRIKEVTSHYLTDLLEANVVLSKGSFQFFSEASFHVSRNFVIRAHGEDEDAYRCVDQVFAKLGTRLKRYKSRLKDLKRHQEHTEPVWSALKYTIDKEVEDQGEDRPLIVAETEKEIHTLSVSEAVMRMDLSESPVLMFRNPHDGHFNVVYRRDDGHIGWIAPNKNGEAK